MENKKSKYPNYFSYLLVAVLAFIVSLQSNSNLLVYRAQGRDSAVFQYVARMMKYGYLPYKDTFDHKGPLLYFINLAGLYIDDKWGIWVIEFLFLAVTCIFMYKTFRLWAGRFISVLVILISFSSFGDYFYGGNFTEEYSLPFIAVSLYIFLDYFKNDKITTLRLLICGMSFGAVLLLRPNNAGLWPVMCLAVIISGISKKQYKSLLKYIMWFMVGSIALAGPFFIWLVNKGIITDFLDCYIRFNLMYSGSSILSRLANVKLFLLDVPILISVVICIYLSVRNKSIRAAGYLIVIISTLFFICLPTTIYGHYGIVMIPVVMCPYAVLLSGLKFEKVTMMKLLGILIAVFSLVLIVTPDSISVYKRAVYDLGHAGEVYYPETYQYIRGFSDHFTAENDRVIYYGNCDKYYLLTDRFSASRFSYQSPIFDTASGLGWSDIFFDSLYNDPPRLVGVSRLNNDVPDMEKMDEFLIDNNYNLVLVTDDLNMYVREEQ